MCTIASKIIVTPKGVIFINIYFAGDGGYVETLFNQARSVHAVSIP